MVINAIEMIKGVEAVQIGNADILDKPSFDDLNIASLIAHWAQVRPDKIALDDGTIFLSFAQTDRLAKICAAQLKAKGLAQGDHFAWLGRNSIAYYISLMAANYLGAIITPMSYRFTPDEISWILEDSGSGLFFVENDFVNNAQKATEMVKQNVNIIDCDKFFADILSAANNGADITENWPALDAHRGVIQLYTSGTTGRPKGALLSCASIFATRPHLEREQTKWAQLTEDAAMIAVMPVSHIGGTGTGLISLFAGARTMICPEFTPAAMLDMIERGGTHTFLVPTAVQMMINHPKAAEMDWSHFKMVLYGASPIPLDLLRQAMQVTGAEFCQQYGMTETSGTFCALPPEDHDPNGNEKMRSAGKAMPGVEIRIVGEDGKPLPSGEIGEIETRSGLNMLGYWQNPEKTEETYNDDGWLKTGDAGYMDDEGYVFLQDRIKDMIISGGENVYPAEVENCLFSHEHVAQVAVFGVPDDKWGEAVKAAIVPVENCNFNEAQFLNWAREKLAAYKVPKSVDVHKDLPRNPTGKIMRRALREPYWENTERSVN